MSRLRARLEALERSGPARDLGGRVTVWEQVTDAADAFTCTTPGALQGATLSNGELRALPRKPGDLRIVVRYIEGKSLDG